MFVNFKPLFLNPALHLHLSKPERPTDKNDGDPCSTAVLPAASVEVFLLHVCNTTVLVYILRAGRLIPMQQQYN
jgi:hypothetical protein